MSSKKIGPKVPPVVTSLKMTTVVTTVRFVACLGNGTPVTVRVTATEAAQDASRFRNGYVTRQRWNGREWIDLGSCLDVQA